MRKFTRSALVAFLSLTPVIACAGEAVHGVWLRDGHREKLEFFDCQGKLCARGIVPQPDGSPPVLVLRYAAKTQANQWKGELFNPENGKSYSGTITLESPAKLTLTGCLIAFLCQSESWTRVGNAPAAAPARGKHF